MPFLIVAALAASLPGGPYMRGDQQMDPAVRANVPAYTVSWSVHGRMASSGSKAVIAWTRTPISRGISITIRPQDNGGFLAYVSEDGDWMTGSDPSGSWVSAARPGVLRTMPCGAGCSIDFRILPSR